MKTVYAMRTSKREFTVVSEVRNLIKGNKYRVRISPVNGGTMESHTKDFKTKTSAIKFGKKYLGVK